MLPHQFQDLLDKFSRGACTPEEEQFIIGWYNNLDDPASNPLSDEEENSVKQKIWATLNPDPPATQKPSFWLPFLAKAAAVTIPLLAVAFFYFSRHSTGRDLVTEIRDTRGKIAIDSNHIFNKDTAVRTVNLPDGSVVILQPSSGIMIADDFQGTTREVRLKGEAFFKVKSDPNKPFVVYSNEVVTRVLGTCFNIRAYENDGEVTVAVKSGKVSVYAGKSKTSSRHQDGKPEEIILTPNQQIVYHRLTEEVSKRLVEKPEIILPNSNLFRMQFENAGVAEIFAVLEQNYGVDIRYDKGLLNNCKLTTSMSDEGLYERIEVICKAIGASYRIDQDAVITITSNGC